VEELVIPARLRIPIAAALLAGALASRAHALDDTALRLTNDVNGVNTGYVRVPVSPEFQFTQFTVEAWVQRVGTGYGFTTDVGGNGIVGTPREGVCGSNICGWHLCWTNDGRINFNLVHTFSSSGVYAATPALATPLGRHHIAASFDADSIRLYVDGALTGAAVWTLGPLYFGAEDLLIGADNWGCGYYRRFDGFIDDVRLWKVARTGAQIANAMNCSLTGHEDGLVAYWPFDDGDLIDATGNGHDGAAVGTAGAVAYGAQASLSTCTVGIWDRPGSASAVSLDVFPHPARDRISIAFTLSRPGPATIELLDITGRRVFACAAREFPAGRHEIVRDLRDLPGGVSSGVLFVRLTSGGESTVRRLVRLR
jgi:hypothetical protein